MSSDKERRRHSSSLENLTDLRAGGGSNRGGQGHGYHARFTDLAEMVCRVRQTTPERPTGFSSEPEDWGEEEVDSEPDSEDIISDPEDYMEEDESGFLSQPSTVRDDLLLHNSGLFRNSEHGSAPSSRAGSNASRWNLSELLRPLVPVLFIS